MRSPITGKKMKLIREADILSFRKEAFNIIYHYYLCEDSGERFTDDQLDSLHMTQVTNQYRERYGIPFPEDIQYIRKQYEVSAKKMSEILGLGTNTYRLYESGEMPTVANGRLILSVREPEEFVRQLQASKPILSDRDYTKLMNQAQALIAARHPDPSCLDRKIVLREDPPSAFNGYRRFSLSRTAQVIAYLGQHIDGLYKTKLNKLLFYADFVAYQQQGRSITGLQYRAIPYGPVPSEYERLFLRLQDEEKLTVEEREGHDDQYLEVYQSMVAFDASGLSTDELQALDKVVRMFGSKKTSELVRISHEEQAWKDNEQDRKLIDYQRYGFGVGELVGI